MRINGRTWPYWALGAATVWFVAIAAFWAAATLGRSRPDDRRPHAHGAGDRRAQSAGRRPDPGPGPTVAVECGSPATRRRATSTGSGPRSAGLVDAAGKLFGGEFVRVPCVEAHRQARLLWYADTALYVLVVAGMGTVLVRRRRHQHVPEAAFATA